MIVITVPLKLHDIWTLHKFLLLQGDAVLLLTDQQISGTLPLPAAESVAR